MSSAGRDETRSGYFISADDRLLFILVEPRRDASNFTDNEHFITAIRGAIGGLRPEFPDVQRGHDRDPRAVQRRDADRVPRQHRFATCLAFALTLVLLLIVRRGPETLVMLAVLT